MVDLDKKQLIAISLVVVGLLAGFFIFGGGGGPGSPEITVNTEFKSNVDVLDVEVRNNQNVERLVLKGEPIRNPNGYEIIGPNGKLTPQGEGSDTLTSDSSSQENHLVNDTTGTVIINATTVGGNVETVKSIEIDTTDGFRNQPTGTDDTINSSVNSS